MIPLPIQHERLVDPQDPLRFGIRVRSQSFLDGCEKIWIAVGQDARKFLPSGRELRNTFDQLAHSLSLFLRVVNPFQRNVRQISSGREIAIFLPRQGIESSDRGKIASRRQLYGLRVILPRAVEVLRQQIRVSHIINGVWPPRRELRGPFKESQGSLVVTRSASLSCLLMQ